MPNIFTNIASLKGTTDRIKSAIRDVPDFPKEGVIFKDITPILNDPQLFRLTVTLFADRYQRMRIDKVVSIDARGFLFGSALAYVLGTGVAIARKKGKLPWHTLEENYELEYGDNTIQMHTDSIKPGERVLIIDDVLATGGTLNATANLVRRLSGEVIEAALLIELEFLKGRDNCPGVPIYSILKY